MTTVVLIEDADSIRKLFEVNLRARGYNVIACNNAVDGLDAMIHNDPDIVLLDLKMPGMDGTDLLDAISDKPAIKDIPVIVVTASVTDARSRLSEHKNVFDIIIKPVEIEDLVQRITEAVER